MVKFEQQLQADLVPEWQDAYCSYAELKGDIRRIKQHNHGMPGHGAANSYSRTGSLGLMKSLVSFKPGLSGAISRRVRPDQTSAASPRGSSKDTIQVDRNLTLI